MFNMLLNKVIIHLVKSCKTRKFTISETNIVKYIPLSNQCLRQRQEVIDQLLLGHYTNSTLDDRKLDSGSLCTLSTFDFITDA